MPGVDNSSPISYPGFTFSPSLKHLDVTLATYLSTNPTVAKLLVCALVMHSNSHVLLVQRAATDGFPLCWECPGGGVENDDETILHALVRELHEETGLKARHIRALVDDKTEFEGRGGIWRKITCLVEVQDSEKDDGSARMPQVSLEPLEHQDFLWATEEEINRGQTGDKDIKFAYEVQRETIKAAFDIVGEGAGSRC